MKKQKHFTRKFVRFLLGLGLFLGLGFLASEEVWGQEGRSRRGVLEMEELLIKGEIQKPQAMFFLHRTAGRELKPRLEELEEDLISKVLSTLEGEPLDVEK